MDAELVTSAETDSTRTPFCCLISSAVLSSSSLPRGITTRFTPSAASPRAIALPMPLLAPVITAARPLSPSSMGKSIAHLSSGNRQKAAQSDRMTLHRKVAHMHSVRKSGDTVLAPHPTYANHSQGYTQASLVDHTSGSVHTGLSMSQLAAHGTLSPHVHSYEEGFYILEGQAAVGINELAYLLGPGDFGAFKVGTPHFWRNAGAAPVRWLQMAAPQPKPDGRERDTFFLKEGFSKDVPSAKTLGQSDLNGS